MSPEHALGKRVRDLRRDLGLSLSELARRARISKAHLSQIENGQIRRPSAEMLHAIGIVLNTSVAGLLGTTVAHEPQTVSVSDSLQAFAEEAHLDEDDVSMLASIRYRGLQPQSEDDWRYLYESIKRSLGDGTER